MAGDAAALLDELMGRSRNVIPGKEVHEVEWCDAEVSQLCGRVAFWLFLAFDLFRYAKTTSAGSVRVTSSRTREQTSVCHGKPFGFPCGCILACLSSHVLLGELKVHGVFAQSLLGTCEKVHDEKLRQK